MILDRKHGVPFWTVVLVLGLCAVVQAETLTGRARAVFDGDTLVLAGGATVRLLGIDAPEVAHKGKAGQYYGREAKQALHELVAGRLLRVEVPGGNRDRYGRALGVVFTGDGASVNEAMVSNGAAFFYWHADAPQALGDRLVAAQREAIQEGKGFWPRIAALPRQNAPYQGNSRSRRFHAPGCPKGAKISKRNRVAFATALDAFKAGYAPARACTPWPGAR